MVVHLPEEKIVFCGDLFLNGMLPPPCGGHVTRTIANYKAIEALEANIYVAGHGGPGTLADVHAQRILLESQFQHSRECFERGISYDAALQALAGDGVSLDFQRMNILSSYCEFTGKPRKYRPHQSEPLDHTAGHRN